MLQLAVRHASTMVGANLWVLPPSVSCGYKNYERKTVLIIYDTGTRTANYELLGNYVRSPCPLLLTALERTDSPL